MTAILIIDDSPEEQELCADLLRGSDPSVQIVTSTTGRGALAQLQNRAFDCVLLDLRLGAEDGIELLGRLHEAAPNLPVIVLTGFGSEDAATEAFVAGAAFYLPKHRLSEASLSTAVARVIRQAEQTRELESKRAALERANRLEALGYLGAGIAHEFNNRLATLRLSLHGLARDSSGNAAAAERARLALQTTEECAHLAQQLMSMTKAGDLMAADVPLAEVFASLQALLGASLPPDIALQIAPTDLVVFCDQRQLLSALVHLIQNAEAAILATGAPGTVALSAAPGEAPDTVQIEVRDTGIGMTPDILAKSTDLFFTTRKLHGSTGLGLSTVHSFAREHEGALLLRSEPGQGTQALLILPQGARAPGQSTVAAPALAETRAHSGARILLAEDNRTLAMVTADILKEAGFQVRLARDGQEALEMLQAGQAADLLLTDIKMPRLDGFALASAARALHPDLPVIYVTGYAAHPKHQGTERHGPILQKPFERDALIDAITAELSAAR